MATLFSVVGFLGGIICLIWLVVRLIKKLPLKPAGISFLACFVVMMIGGVLSLPDADTDDLLDSQPLSSEVTEDSNNAVIGSDAPEQELADTDEPSDNQPLSSEVTDDSSNDVVVSDVPNRGLLDEFFVTIGSDVRRDDIETVAKNMGLHIDERNSGTGIYTYRIALEKNVASAVYHEKGSLVTVSYNALANDVLTEITYFDEERMIAGYWSSDTGYLLADYNYPQIVYYNEDTDKVCSRTPVSSAKEIVDYSFSGSAGENLLEVLFASITSETTKNDLLSFVDAHGLSYNSRGAGNEEVIAYCYEVGAKFGENGSYITFDSNSDNLITKATYWYYPANYTNGYSANFYSESYSSNNSVPSGFVLVSKDGSIEYSSAEELLAQIHSYQK